MNERIKLLRKALKLTQQEMADRLKINRGTYANYEIGRNIPIDAVISLICQEFSVSETWLRTGKGDMFVQTVDGLMDQLTAKYHLNEFGQAFIKGYLLLGEKEREVIRGYVDSLYAQMEKEKPKVPTRYISYLGKIAAAGTFVDSFSMIINRPLEIEDNYQTARAAFAIGVSGDSMEPDYSDGDVLLVSEATAIDEGDVGIFQYQGSLYVKRCAAGELESINPKYPPIPNDGDIRVLGVVIGKA